jgi:hypothetical protein
MEIKVHKTYEIEKTIWDKIADSFNQAFDGHNITGERLRSTYTANSFDYSYHAYIQDNDKIIAFNTIRPSYYNYKGNRLLFGLSGSTFVLKEYRKDIFILADIHDALIEYCKKEGMVAFLGVPNKNSYKYSTSFLSFKDVFSLHYYVMPVKLSNILKVKNPIFNLFSLIYSNLSLGVNLFLSLLINNKEKTGTYRIDVNDDYLEKRFSSLSYKQIQKGNKKAWYIIINEDGIQTAYIIDFRQDREKTFHSLLYAVRFICREEKVDIVMYVGTMNFRQLLLMKIPRKMEPKRLPFTYCLLNENDENKFKDMNDRKNWDFGLLNLDVR